MKKRERKGKHGIDIMMRNRIRRERGREVMERRIRTTFRKKWRKRRRRGRRRETEVALESNKRRRIRRQTERCGGGKERGEGEAGGRRTKWRLGKAIKRMSRRMKRERKNRRK